MNSDDVYYDNVGNFLGTGFMQKYDISLSGGNDKYSAYASANFMDNEGVVPKDYKKRMGVFVKGEFTPSKAMKIMLSANFIDSKSRGFGNSMSTIYGWSINRDMADYRLENGLPQLGQSLRRLGHPHQQPARRRNPVSLLQSLHGQEPHRKLACHHQHLDPMGTHQEPDHHR